MERSANEFSLQESLQLIRSMIESTKHSFSDKSHYFLVWGWATMVACIVQYVLLVIVRSPYHSVAWTAMIVAFILHIIFMCKDSKEEQKVKTFVGEATGTVWMSIGFAFFTLPFIFYKIGWEYCFPFYILLYGIGTFISGRLLKFRPLMIGGAGCLLLVIFTAYFRYEQQILVAAFAILISYIIPGHLLRNQYRRSVKNQR